MDQKKSAILQCSGNFSREKIFSRTCSRSTHAWYLSIASFMKRGRKACLRRGQEYILFTQFYVMTTVFISAKPQIWQSAIVNTKRVLELNTQNATGQFG